MLPQVDRSNPPSSERSMMFGFGIGVHSMGLTCGGWESSPACTTAGWAIHIAVNRQAVSPTRIVLLLHMLRSFNFDGSIKQDAWNAEAPGRFSKPHSVTL